MKGFRTFCVGILFITCIQSLEARSRKHPHTIIAWDLHDVLLQRSGTFATIWHYEGLGDILKHCPLALAKGIMLLLWYNIFTDMSSQPYVNLAYHHSNPCLADLVIRITNSQKLMPGMLEIVKELHTLGYDQQILSNIGIEAFTVLTDPHKYPQFAELFSYMNLKKSQVVGNQGIHKPNPEYYHEYLLKNHLNTHKYRIIFIDDKLINVVAAQELGFTPIHFKNPDQLRRALQSLSVPIPRLATPKHTVLNPIPRTLTVQKSIPRRMQIHSLSNY